VLGGIGIHSPFYQCEEREFLHMQELRLMILHCPFVCEAIMRLFSRIVAIATVPAWIGIHVDPAAAQTFNERWSIIPKAHAEPAPEAPGHTTQDPQTQPPIGAEPTRGSEDRSATRSFNRVFSGKASYYSYLTGKTASGSSFDRNLPTAAHRSLPFGTRVRVTDLATNKSVTVIVTDRGPKASGRILDLSLGAARNLGITDRGVVQVRAEVL
jgi:rare lipoprotein A